MRYHPCGYGCDWIRYPYTTDCRFFRDSDRVNKVRWTFAEEGAATFPGWSIIQNDSLEPDAALWQGVGEVSGAARPFTGQKTPAGLFTGHFCGSFDDFDRGGMLDETPPLVRYAANGYALCCGPPKLASAGAGVGGRAALVIEPPTPAPGMSCVGATPIQLGRLYSWTATNLTQPQWWVYLGALPNTTYRLRTTGLLPWFPTLIEPFLDYDNCSSLFHQLPVGAEDVTYTTDSVPGKPLYFWLSVSALFTLTQPYTFILTQEP